MSDTRTYLPQRRTGILFHAILLTVLGGIILLGTWQVGRTSLSLQILAYLLLTLIGLALAPVFIYRLYALLNASYQLERDGIHLRWGLRSEDIPSNQVQWVQFASHGRLALKLPALHWPGSVLGGYRLPDGREVEFMADRVGPEALLVISTPKRVFAISPAEPQEFLRSYQRLIELGSISPISAQSTFPALLLTHFWRDLTARWLALGSLSLGLFLWVMVILVIPGRAQVAWLFTPTGAAQEYVPASRMLLLPVINTGFVLLDTLLGLFFYRREEYRILALLFWFAAGVTSALFALGIGFMLAAR